MMAGKPFAKKGRSVFWVSIALICAAIGTTLLLANDMRNLRAAFRHYDIAWPFDAAPAPVATSPPVKEKKRLPQAIQLPDRFFETAKPELLGRFQRQVFLAGPDLCALFNEAGIANTGWQTSPFNPNSSECISERKLVRAENPDDIASFFLSMKGTPDGAVKVIRIKLILPNNTDGEAMKHELVEAVRILIGKTALERFHPGHRPDRET